MSELISGKDALIALANGEEVQHFNKKMATFGNLVKDEEWGCCDELTISDFNSDLWAFRLKPRTITLNGIEVPSVKYVAHSGGNCVKISCECPEDAAAISAALRSVFGKK